VERKDFLVTEKEIPIVVPKRLMVFAGQELFLNIKH